MLRWLQRRFDPRLLCDGKRRRFDVASVLRQGRRHNGICEQIGDHRPFGHTLVPIQSVLWESPAVPHFFQLRLFVRPASLALHVNVDVHGFFFSPGETEKRSGQRFGSDSEAVVVASVGKFVHESSIRFPKRSAADRGRYSRSRGCKLRGGPKISRRMIAPRKPDVDASNVAMSVLRFAPLGTVREAAV